MPGSPESTGASPPLQCCRCRYDLRGLDAGGVCPECGCPVAESVARVRPPLPAWVRHLRTAYFTAWTVVIASPFALPPVARALGMPVNLGRHGAYFDILARCILPIGLAGIVLACALADRRHSLTWLVAASLVLLCLWVVPSLGH